MATTAAFVILIAILYCSQEHVSCQSTNVVLYDTNGEYMVCAVFGTAPMMCSPPIEQNFYFFEMGITARNLAISEHLCDGTYYGYHLFDTSPSQIYRVLLPIPISGGVATSILDTTAGISNVITFEVCCDRIFFATANKVYVQNIDDSGGVRITSLLYEVSGDITLIDVCCYNDNYNIFHTINDDGLYMTSMDGRTTNKIINYGPGVTVQDFDLNCGIGHLALGVGDSVFVFNFNDADPSTFPIALYSLFPWERRIGETVNAISLAAEETTLAPNFLTAWSGGDGDGYALTFTTESGVSSLTTPGTSFDRVFDNIFLCLDEQDCSLGCPSDNTCPCDVSDLFQSCCAGLCVQQSGSPGQDSECRCHDEDTIDNVVCFASVALPTPATGCSLDLIGAVKGQGGSRFRSSSIYALSLYSTTTICATDVRGKQQPLPRGTFPLETNGMYSSGYLFQGPTDLKNYHGNRYGLYSVLTTYQSIGESQEQVTSFPVIVQERSDALFAQYLTISANVNTEVTIRMCIARQIDTRRVRWQKNGNFISKYNGRLALTFDHVTSSNEGIYEVYFQRRLKRDWRQIIRVIVRNDNCGSECVARGGVCSYSDSYCVCPPGRVGVMCEAVCDKGTFGLRRDCRFSCQEEFGDDNSDCQDVLFCLEDPFGCQCYPGYEQPNCSPCGDGFFGMNCMEACTCTTGQQCDPYDGTCT